MINFILQEFQAVDGAGDPLAFGYLWTYESGTDDPTWTYAAVAGSGPGGVVPGGRNEWPLQLDDTGSTVFFIPTTVVCRFNVQDKDHNQMDNWPVDGYVGMVEPPTIVGPVSPAGLSVIYPETSTVQFSATFTGGKYDHLVWSATGGTIDQTGLWMVEQTFGTYTIKAASYIYPLIFQTTTITAIPVTTVTITSPI